MSRAVALHGDRLSRAVTHAADLPRDTQAWLASIEDGLHQRLARAGLCSPRVHHRPEAIVLGKMCDSYIATRCDVTEGTKSVMRQFRIHACRVLGESTPIAALTTGHANAFRAKVLADHSPAYVCKMVKLGRQMFRDAVERRLIDANSFAGVRAGAAARTGISRYRLAGRGRVARVFRGMRGRARKCERVDRPERDSTIIDFPARKCERGRGAAPGAAVADAGLEALIVAWPRLPAAVRAGIVAMVRAAGGTSPDVDSVATPRRSSQGEAP